jgi:hypothetical protein
LNQGQFARTLVKVQQFQVNVDATQNANNAQTWKEICFDYVDTKKL